jgi:hypothetical protein
MSLLPGTKQIALGLTLVASMLASACMTLPAQPGTVEAPTPVIVEVTPEVTQPVPTQTDTPVETAAPTETTAPQPAPDGALTVAYTRAGDAWLWREGGTPKQYTYNGQVMDVRLSDDGQVLAYLKQLDDTHFELWAVNGDGTGDRALVSGEFLNNIDPRAYAVAPHRYEWVPGTHMLAFNTRQVFQGPGLIQYNDLNLVDADTGEIKTLLPIGEGGDFYYSPDGSQIALTTSETIVLVNADGTNRRRALEFQPVNTASEYQFYPAPVWSPDSSRLMVVIPPQDPWSRPLAPSTLYHLPVDGTPAVQMMNIEAMYVPGYQLISPDLQYLVYTKEVGAPEENLREVRIVRLSDLSDSLVQTGTLLMSYGWLTPGLFVFTGGETTETYFSTTELIAPVLLGSGGAQFTTSSSEKVVYAMGNTTWTLNLLSEGATQLIDTFDGNLPVIDLAE